MSAPRPYQIERDGKKLFVASEVGEDLLATAYLRMVQEGLLEYMFWSKPPSLREFLEWGCARKDVIVIGGFVDDGACVELGSLGWVRDIQERCGKRFADTGELVFRKFQAMGVSHDLIRLMLDFAFEQVGVEALYGITPAKNIPAVRFMRQSGFGSTPEVPLLCCLHGELCGGVISWFTREQWMIQTGREKREAVEATAGSAA